jgi:hypothetical protein
MTMCFSIGSWKLLRCCRNPLPGNERTNHLLTQAGPWNLRRAGSHPYTFWNSQFLDSSYLSYMDEDHNCSSFKFFTTLIWLIIFVMKFLKFLIVHSVTASLLYISSESSIFSLLNEYFVRSISLCSTSIFKHFKNSITILSSFFFPQI